MSHLKVKIAPLLDIVLAPFTLFGALLLGLIRRLGISRMPVSKKIIDRVGVFPIRDHYHEPLFKASHMRKSLREDRDLPGIDLNVQGQLDLLSRFEFNDELLEFSADKGKELEFYYHNGAFESGDAEYFYNIIRNC